MTKTKLKVAVLGHGNKGSYFSNGLHQNSWSLAKMLNKSPILDVSYYVQKNQMQEGVDSIYGIKLKPYGEDALKEDILFCTSYYPGEKDIENLKNNNTKIVVAHYGNHLYYHLEDYVNFDSKNRKRMDLWPRKYQPECLPDIVIYSPHFADQREYFGFVEDLPVEKVVECPYIWTPQFLNRSIIESSKSLADYCFSREHTELNKNIVAMESNLSFTKTNFIPCLIAEQLHHENPESFEHAWIFGSSAVREKEDSEYIRVAFNKLNVFKNKKISFEARYSLPFILTKGKVLLSHQVLNALNYIYLEFAYFRLPFVHNSEMIGNAGYHYHRSNIYEGANQLEKALNHSELSDAEIKIYNESCKELLWKHSIENPDNLEGYMDIIRSLY